MIPGMQHTVELYLETIGIVLRLPGQTHRVRPGHTSVLKKYRSLQCSGIYAAFVRRSIFISVDYQDCLFGCDVARRQRYGEYRIFLISILSNSLPGVAKRLTCGASS